MWNSPLPPFSTGVGRPPSPPLFSTGPAGKAHGGSAAHDGRPHEDHPEWPRWLAHLAHLSPPPFGLIWLLPSGRYALWFVSALGLALMLTVMPPTSTMGGWELLLAFYLVGWVQAEWNEKSQSYAGQHLALVDGGGPSPAGRYWPGPHTVHCHAVHLPLGALLIPRTMCCTGTGATRSTCSTCC